MVSWIKSVSSSRVVIVVVLLAYFAFVHHFDTRWRYVPYNLAVTMLFASMIFFATRRLAFSVYASIILSGVLTFVSVIKYKLKGLALHIYDFIYVGSDKDIVGFLLRYYTLHVVFCLALVFAGLVVITMVYRLEKPVRSTPLARAGAVVLCMAISWATFQPTKRDADFLPFIAGYNASAFHLSLAHVPNLVQPLPLHGKIAAAKLITPLADSVECNAADRSPDFFLVLSESQTSPLVLDKATMTTGDIDSFRSSDGKIRPLFVEIFGGGTWMTNFSVLTGLSSADLGWQGPYVNQLLEGRIKGALPSVLRRCGYRTVALMPMTYHSVNEGPFLKSLGFEEVYDASAMALPVMGVRDNNYFRFAKKLLADHRSTDDRPLFVLIQTMFTHSPYDHPLRPVPRENHVYTDDGEANEYLHRVSASREDVSAFLSFLKSQPGENGSLFVEFGDHQSVATKDMVMAKTPGTNPLTDFRSKAYETFYAIHGFETDVDFSQLHQPEDAPFLLGRVIASTSLPTSPLFRELNRLSDVCKGRFHTCSQRRHVDAFLRMRADAGMLDLN